jgi:hypothetical protein
VAVCEICGGAGVKEIDGKLYECKCAELRRIAAAMPSYIRAAKVKMEHITFKVDDTTRLIDATGRSLYVISYWNDMRAFIKLVMLKHRNKHLRIISDRELRDVYVGSTSRSARGEDSKEPIYNSVEDLVRGPHLIIIRLNELAYKNKAAAGILEEAMSYRLDRNEPIWLLSNATKPFGPGSFAYSDNVWALIKSMPNIRVPQISEIDGPTDLGTPVQSVANSPLQPELVESSAPRTKPRKIRSARDEDEDTDRPTGGLSAYGQGVKPGKRL